MPQDNAPSNPANIVSNESVGRSWVDDVPGLAERRRAIAARFTIRTTQPADERVEGSKPITTARAYDGGLEEMLERGMIAIEPMGDRVLLRGIMPEDASDDVKQLPFDGRRVVASELLALGVGAPEAFRRAGFTDETMPKPGQVFWVLTTVADRLASKNKTVRLMTVRAEHLGARIHLVDKP